ncbi:MAG: hypothetical protein V2A57_04200 [Elusimicrobiota bacterium]
MTDKTCEKDSEKPPKMSKVDNAILYMAKEHPEASTHQLGNYVKDLGVIKHPATVYKRLSKNTYLRGEIKKIRDHNAEFVSRELVPEALKIHRKILKSRVIPDKEKKDWVFQAEKMEFRLDEKPGIQQTVNIRSIENLQLLIGGAAQKRVENLNNTDTV